MAFVTQIVEQEGGEVRYFTATENGECAWYFIRLFPERYSEYKKKLSSPSFPLREYGEILASGWGEHAPPDVMQMMRERYKVKI